MLAYDVNDCLSFLLEDLATAVAVHEVSQKVRALPEVMTFNACRQDYVQMCKSSQVLGWPVPAYLGIFLIACICAYHHLLCPDLAWKQVLFQLRV